MKKNNQNYKLHFRGSNVPFLMMDLWFHEKGYGVFDYWLLLKGGYFSGYLSEKGWNQAEEFGKKLDKKEHYNLVVQELNKLILEFRDFSHAFERGEFAKLDLEKQWKEISRMFKNFATYYRYCDEPMLRYWEKIVEKAAGRESVDLVAIFKNKKTVESFSRKEKKALNIVLEFGDLKFKVHQEIEIMLDVLSFFIENLSKKLFLTSEQAFHFKASEVERVLSGGNFDLDELNKRINGSVLIANAKKDERYSTGNDYEKWKEILEPKSEKIKGKVAYPGKIKGKVALHLNLFKGAEIPKNSVLVSGMTNPQMVPFLKNAIAIVTDEGGLTCHAAIISRELKIPCIVGTGNATQVLKDGDIVEVDAEKGVAKKIK